MRTLFQNPPVFLRLLCFVVLLESCMPAAYLTSEQIGPQTPHLIFKTGDTLYAADVKLKARFLAKARFIADSSVYPHDTLKYVYTSKHQKLAMTKWGGVQQTVQGRLNIYSGVNARTVTPDSSTLYLVHHPELRFLQQSPDGILQPFNYEIVGMMIRDNPSSFKSLQQAKGAKAMFVGSVIGGSILGGVGLITLMAGALTYDSREATRILTYGLISVAASLLTFSIAVPVSRHNQRYFEYQAIERYNRR